MKPEKAYRPHRIYKEAHDIDIHVIGAGGNGSHFLKNLASMIYFKRMTNFSGTIRVRVFDPDVIEEHNVGRQAFNPIGVSENKAVNIVNRINRTYGLNFKAKPVLFDLNKCQTQTARAQIFVLAVDTVSFRSKFYFRVSDTQPDVIDMGNGDNFGQIMHLWSPDLYRHKHFKNYLAQIRNMPDHDNRPSCSHIESVNTQGLFVNSLMGNLAANMIFNLIHYDYPKAPFATYLNTKTMNVNSLSVPIKR